MEWKFCQVFGDRVPKEEVNQQDVISHLRFDTTGDYLSVGDKGGRVIIFHRLHHDSVTKRRPPEYRYYTEFQSHESEFDYLRSLDIEEKITGLEWLPPRPSSHLMLSTNAKKIKLWMINERTVKKLHAAPHTRTKTRLQASVARNPNLALRIPTLEPVENIFLATPLRIYQQGHAHHINALSLSPDQQHYISSDDLRVNLWNLEQTDEVYQIVDLQPEDLDKLYEVITCSRFHPLHSHLFGYSTSRGTVRIVDTRARARGEHAMVEAQVPAFDDSFFNEVVHSVSDLQFLPDGEKFITRDFFSVKLWDIRNPIRPVRTISVHEHLREQLVQLYDSDNLFDRFSIAFSHSGSHFLTGSYDNIFHIYDSLGTTDTAIEASRVLPKRMGRRRGRSKTKTSAQYRIDFEKKILNVAWHPHENLISVATLSNLFVYAAPS